MLKTKPLTQLLSQSISSNVSSALLFTPSGSLLATATSPTSPDAKKARTNAALAANIWAAYDRATDDGDDDDGGADALKNLTLELADYNMHIALVAPRVLLCLLGPRTPPPPTTTTTRYSSSRSSAHSQETELRLTPPAGSTPKSSSNNGGGSVASVRTVAIPTTPVGGLGILKTQAQALASYLEQELKGYQLPEGL